MNPSSMTLSLMTRNSRSRMTSTRLILNRSIRTLESPMIPLHPVLRRENRCGRTPTR